MNIQSIYEIPSTRHKDAICWTLTLLEDSILHNYIEDVLLYGSCARGEENEDSDVDLFVIFSSDIEQVDNFAELRRAMRYLRGNAMQEDVDNAVEVDIHMTIGNEWETSPELYYQNIKREGISIWG